MSLIECLSDVGKQINIYETINKAARLHFSIRGFDDPIFWLTQVTAASSLHQPLDLSCQIKCLVFSIYIFF